MTASSVATQVKSFARLSGLTAKSDRHGVTLHGKITWNGTTHVGWMECFEGWDEALDFINHHRSAGSRPWAKAA